MELGLINNQAPEKPVYRNDGSLEVFRIWRTLQGEGPLAGTPAIFVRLAGCSLKCNQCDTDYTSHRELIPYVDVKSTIVSLSQGSTDLVVITGGEPFRQNLSPFCWTLLEAGYRVQIETNGIHPPSDNFPVDTKVSMGVEVSIVCSPKTPKVHTDLLPLINSFKYVLDADYVDPHDGLPTDVLGSGLRPARPGFEWGGDATDIFVQPLDDVNHDGANIRHLQAAVESCMKYGYRLSYQLHKLIGLE